MQPDRNDACLILGLTRIDDHEHRCQESRARFDVIDEIVLDEYGGDGGHQRVEELHDENCGGGVLLNFLLKH